MESFRQALYELLPGYLHKIIGWEFIPMEHVKDRHQNMQRSALTSLFEAYLLVEDYLDIQRIASEEISEDSWGCMRCGFCCSAMRPGPVDAAIYSKWKDAGVPVAWFYSSNVKRKKKSTRAGQRKNQVYRCWYHNGIRLRICPFMFLNLNDHKPFCSIYHMGDDYRPPVCSMYIPRHETCTSKPVEIEPWENT